MAIYLVSNRRSSHNVGRYCCLDVGSHRVGTMEMGSVWGWNDSDNFVAILLKENE